LCRPSDTRCNQTTARRHYRARYGHLLAAQLVDQLEERAWAVAAAAATAYNGLFRKGRAAAAKRCTHDTDDGALAESVYEASHAIGSEDVGDALITDERPGGRARSAACECVGYGTWGDTVDRVW